MDVQGAGARGGLRFWLAEGAVLLIVLLLAWKATHAISAVRDLDGTDEQTILLWASSLDLGYRPPASTSPLYVLWQRLLLTVEPDPAEVGALNWSILAALTPLSLYAAARSLGAGRLAALSMAGLLLGTTFVDVWPYAAHLAAAVALAGLAAAARLRSPPAALAVLGVAVLLASLIRPEIALGHVLAVAVFLAVACRRFRQGRATWLAAGCVLLACCAASAWAFGSPLLQKSGRPAYAFAQHYALNRIIEDGLPRESFVHFEGVYREDFGDAATVGQAARANPRRFGWHVANNVKRLPRACQALVSPQTALPHLYYLVLVGDTSVGPGRGGARSVFWAGVVVLVGFLAFCLAGWLRGRPTSPYGEAPRTWQAVVALALLGVPAL